MTDPASPTFYDDYDIVGNAQKILLQTMEILLTLQILMVGSDSQRIRPRRHNFVGAFDTDGIAHDLALSPMGYHMLLTIRMVFSH